MKAVILFSIDLYKRYLSPYKGFSCAHAWVHGGDSCSTHIRTIVAEEGIWHGYRKIRQRFRACRAAYLSISDAERDKRKKRKQSSDRDCQCNSCDCNPCFEFSLPTKKDCPIDLPDLPCDSGPCDVGPCDCSW